MPLTFVFGKAYVCSESSENMPTLSLFILSFLLCGCFFVSLHAPLSSCLQSLSNLFHDLEFLYSAEYHSCVPAVTALSTQCLPALLSLADAMGTVR